VPEISLDLLRARIGELESTLEKSRSADRIEGGGGGPHIPGVNERLARLETGFDWAKTLVGIVGALVVTITLGGFAFLGVQQTRIDARLFALGEQMNSLPGKINANIQDLTKTLSEAIAASKQTPPQIVVLPTQPIQPTVSSKP
jgi:hypothetical protein